MIPWGLPGVSHEERHAILAIDLQQVFKQDMNRTDLLIFPESPDPVDLQNQARIRSPTLEFFIYRKNELVIPSGLCPRFCQLLRQPFP